MDLEILGPELSVCKLDSMDQVDIGKELFFLSRTDDEISLVCPTSDVPEETLSREDGWRAFRIRGTLDFSLIGILSGITTVLAKESIGVFAISTFDTDYILVRSGDLERAKGALSKNGYSILPSD